MLLYSPHHDKRVSNPERIPATRAGWDLDGLTVHRYHHSRSLTNCTSVTGKHAHEKDSYSRKYQTIQRNHKPADEGFDALTGNRGHAHGHGLWRGEPVGIVITRSKVTYIVDVAEEERHWAELP